MLVFVVLAPGCFAPILAAAPCWLGSLAREEDRAESDDSSVLLRTEMPLLLWPETASKDRRANVGGWVGAGDEGC